MSTSCIIRVEDHVEYGKVSHLYHHCDGYFMGVGLELALALCKWQYNNRTYLSWFDFNRDLPRIYKDIDRDAVEVQRIEYAYTLKIDKKGVRLKGFKRDSWDAPVGNWESWDSYILYEAPLSLGDPISFSPGVVPALHLLSKPIQCLI